MTYNQIIAYIQQWIYDNMNKEITAEIVRDVLEKIVRFIDDRTGDTSDLFNGDDLTEAINLLNQDIQKINLEFPLKVFEGTENPNINPPSNFNAPDFYVRKNGDIKETYIYTGDEWVRIGIEGINISDFLRYNEQATIIEPWEFEHPLKVGDAIDDEDAINKGQLDEALEGIDGKNIYNSDGKITETRNVTLEEDGKLFIASEDAAVNLDKDVAGLIGGDSEVAVGSITGVPVSYDGVIIRDKKLRIKIEDEQDPEGFKVAEISYDNVRQLILKMQGKSSSNTDFVQEFQNRSGVIALMSDIENVDVNEIVDFLIDNDKIKIVLEDNTEFSIDKDDFVQLFGLGDLATKDTVGTDDIEDDSVTPDKLDRTYVEEGDEGDKNVQSDLAETDEDSDAFVKNKGKLATKDKVSEDDIDDGSVTPDKLDKEYAEKEYVDENFGNSISFSDGKLSLKDKNDNKLKEVDLSSLSAGNLQIEIDDSDPNNIEIVFKQDGQEVGRIEASDLLSGVPVSGNRNGDKLEFFDVSNNKVFDIELDLLKLGTTEDDAYRGDRGKTAYDHSQETGTNPHEVTKSDVGLSNVKNKEQLGKDETAANSDKLGGKDATEYSTKQWVEDKGYLVSSDISGKEDASNKIDEIDFDRKSEDKYASEKAVAEAIIQVKNDFLEVDSVQTLRDLDSKYITLLSNEDLKYVRVLGYHEKGDTPAPINYYISNTNESDNGGSVIEVGNIKLEHKFKNTIDIRYFGAKKEQNIDDVMESIISSTDGIEIYVPVGVWYVTKTITLNSYTVMSGGSTTTALTRNQSIIRYNGPDLSKNDFIVLMAGQSNVKRLAVNGAGRTISGFGTKGEFSEFEKCLAYNCKDGFSIFGDSYQSRINGCYAMNNDGRGVVVESRGANASGPQAVLINDTYSSKNKIGVELGGGTGNTIVFSKEVGANTENNIKLTEGNWRMMGSAWAEPPSSSIHEDYVSVICEGGVHTIEGDIYSTFGIKIIGGDIISNSPQYRSQYPMKSIKNNDIVFWYSFDEENGSKANSRYKGETIDIGENSFSNIGQFGTSLKIEANDGFSGIDPIHCDFRKPMELLFNFKSLNEDKNNVLFTLTGILTDRFLSLSFENNKLFLTRYNGENSTTERQSMYVSGEQNWISLFFHPDESRVLVYTMGGRSINVVSVKISSHLGSGDGTNNLLHIGVPSDGRVSGEKTCEYEIDEIICFNRELSPTEKSHFAMMGHLPKNIPNITKQEILEESTEERIVNGKSLKQAIQELSNGGTDLDKITKAEILEKSTEKRSAEGKAIHEAILDLLETKQFSISSNTNISSSHNQGTLFVSNGIKLTITPSNIPEKFECFVNNNSSSNYVEIALNSESGWTYKVNNKDYSSANTYIKEAGMAVIMRELSKKIIYINGDIDED